MIGEDVVSVDKVPDSWDVEGASSEEVNIFYVLCNHGLLDTIY